MSKQISKAVTIGYLLPDGTIVYPTSSQSMSLTNDLRIAKVSPVGVGVTPEFRKKESMNRFFSRYNPKCDSVFRQFEDPNCKDLLKSNALWSRVRSFRQEEIEILIIHRTPCAFSFVGVPFEVGNDGDRM